MCVCCIFVCVFVCLCVCVCVCVLSGCGIFISAVNLMNGVWVCVRVCVCVCVCYVCVCVCSCTRNRECDSRRRFHKLTLDAASLLLFTTFSLYLIYKFTLTHKHTLQVTYNLMGLDTSSPLLRIGKKMYEGRSLLLAPPRTTLSL